MKKIRIFAAFFAFFLIIPHVIAAEDFTINAYQVILKVNENNTFDITENISVNFTKSKHGIIRLIPLQNKIVRLDGTKSRNRPKISNVEVNEKFKTFKENGNMALKIGDPDKTIKGSKLYTIKYKYDIGKDPLKGKDELYFNIIGTDWETTIDNVLFFIYMPKKFDREKLGFSAGALDSTNSDNIEFKVEGNVITGRYKGTLNPNEGLTVRLELPEGYFVKTNSHFDFKMIPSLLLSIIFFAVFFMIWIKYGKNDPVIETVEFYPPNGLNSAETAFWYNGSVKNEDIISLLIYLANKGYIKISEKELITTPGNETDGKPKGFKITKVKEYDGNNASEKTFLEGLFQKKTIIPSTEVDRIMAIINNDKTSKDKTAVNEMVENVLKAATASTTAGAENSVTEVTDTELRNKFYLTLNKINEDMNSKENKETVIEKSSKGKSPWGVLMIIAIYVLITARPMLEYGDSTLLLLALIFPGFGFSALFSAIFFVKEKIIKGFLIIWGAGFGVAPWFAMVLPAILADTMYQLTYLTGSASIFGIMFLIKNMPKRTVLGNERLGKIRGFRTFLTLAEKPKLEELVARDPEYFYNILPFTYVLGVSDKWIKKFETIAMAPPNWYSGRSSYNSRHFGTFMTSTMKSANNVLSSRPASSSGSGSRSSGGGSSGRGSGGGGGRSW